ncbi:hypothetical protein FOXYSP1_01413 [Fusarium oxysporum f. sp. phaseoli]
MSARFKTSSPLRGSLDMHCMGGITLVSGSPQTAPWIIPC